MRDLQKIKPFDHWNTSVRSYNFFGDYLWHKFGHRVLKLPINAGFTCPNRDGSKGSGGCIFCSGDGSSSPASGISTDIFEQMQNAKESFVRSEAETRYIAYFQSFTNTYADTDTLRQLYSNALSFPDVIGLMIATRPDCLPDEVLDLISEFNKPGTELTLEIGMQSMHKKSLKFLNRGHSHKETVSAIKRANKRNIPVLAHVILGINGESWKDMMRTATEISSLPVDGVKIHHLHVIKGTKLEEYYNQNKIKLPEFEEYVSLVCDFIERLRPDIIIHRLVGDRSLDSLAAPIWANNKGTVLNAIEDKFRKRSTIQGFFYNEF